MATKRLRFFKYFFTGAKEWLEEQLYHRLRMQRHNRLVHGWGIGSGLRLVPTEPATMSVIIPAGLAVDANGEELLLEANQSLDLSSARPETGEKTVYVALRYSEHTTDEVYVEATGKNEPTRIEEVTSIVVLEAPPGTPYVEIGRVRLSHDAERITAAVDPANPGVNEIDLRYTRTLHGGAGDIYAHEILEAHKHDGKPGQPAKVVLTDGQEVQGKLPGSMVENTVPDADTVDGIHASRVPKPAHLLALNESGLFPNSVLERGLVRAHFDHVSDSYDWNNATTPGIYHGHASANAPGGAATEKVVLVARHDADDFFQLMLDISGNMFYRACHKHEWRPWRMLWHSENMGPESGLDADTLRGYTPDKFAGKEHGHPIVTETRSGFMAPYMLQHLQELSQYVGHNYPASVTYEPAAVLQNQGDDYVTPMSGTGVEKAFVAVTARVQGEAFAGRYTQTVTIRWRLQYRKNGGGWVNWRSDSYSKSVQSPVLTTRKFAYSVVRNYEISLPAGTSDRYEFRVLHDGEEGDWQGYWGATEKAGTWVRVDEVTIQRRFQPL